MLLVVFLCAVQNVALYEEISIQRVPHDINKITHVDFKKYDWKPLKSIDTFEVNNKPRRLFQWIKNMLKKNATTQTPKFTYEDIVNEKIRFRQIERNLTVTLTKLSHVLNQILNIVKYSRNQNFDDLHKFIPTKLTDKHLDGVRVKRDITAKKGANETKKETKDDKAKAIERQQNFEDLHKLTDRNLDKVRVKRYITARKGVNAIEKETIDTRTKATEKPQNFEDLHKLTDRNLDKVRIKRDITAREGVVNAIEKETIDTRTKATGKPQNFEDLHKLTDRNLDKVRVRRYITARKGVNVIEKEKIDTRTKAIEKPQNFEDLHNLTDRNLNKVRIKRDITVRDGVVNAIKKEGIDTRTKAIEKPQNFEDLHKLTDRNLDKVRIKRDITAREGVVNAIKKEGIDTRTKDKEKNNFDRLERDINGTNKDDKAVKEGKEDKKVIDNTEGSNGRRAMLPINTITNNEVKIRLFKYIDEAFTDIANKIASLIQTKQMFSQDVNFRIGYIISNIDTLDVNMRNLKRDMEKNKLVWDDRKILNLYDTVKVSNTAVNELLDILNVYVDKSLN